MLLRRLWFGRHCRPMVDVIKCQTHIMWTSIWKKSGCYFSILLYIFDQSPSSQFFKFIRHQSWKSKWQIKFGVSISCSYRVTIADPTVWYQISRLDFYCVKWRSPTRVWVRTETWNVGWWRFVMVAMLPNTSQTLYTTHGVCRLWFQYIHRLTRQM